MQNGIAWTTCISLRAIPYGKQTNVDMVRGKDTPSGRERIGLMRKTLVGHRTFEKVVKAAITAVS